MNPTTSLVPLDREINKTLRELKKKKKHEKQASKQPVGSTSNPQNSSVASNNTFLDQHFIMAERREDHREHEREAREHEHERERRERREQEDEHHFEGGRQLHDDERPMREFTQSYASFAPQGFYANPANFEIKGSLLAHLPKFTGFPHEDAHTHLLGLYHTCSSMKPPNADLDDVLLRVFQFSLEGKAKEWLLNLPTHYATLSWEQLKKVFLDRYFPVSKISKLRKDITGVQQFSQETFYEYWSRFNTLVNSCPNHNISKGNLVQYFYDGLVPQLKMSVDAASNGSLFNLSANEGWNLFSTMASNHQNFYGRDALYGAAPKVASVSSDDKLYNSIERLTESLSRMDGRFVQPAPCVDDSMALVASSCDHCGSSMHLPSDCPSHYQIMIQLMLLHLVLRHLNKT